jgi:hypothetical protein
MRWLCLLLPVFLFACGEKTTPSTPKKPATEITYEITKGESVGTLNIKPGEFGTFTPAATKSGEEFVSIWESARKEGAIAVTTESRKGGSRSYGARLYRPADSEYAESVRWFLLDRYYEARVIPNPAPASAPTSQP